MCRRTIGVAVLVSVLSMLGTPAFAQVERFRGTIANTTGIGPGVVQFMIQVERYTSDEEADRFFELLTREGPEGLEREMQIHERARFRLDGQLGHSLGLARSNDIGDGVRIVRFVAARPISIFEQVDASRSLDYPFTVIVFRLDETGRGAGIFLPAAKLRIGDDDQLEVEAFGLVDSHRIPSVEAQP